MIYFLHDIFSLRILTLPALVDGSINRDTSLVDDSINRDTSFVDDSINRDIEHVEK